ncbi:MAG TPA: 3-hydroxyacyl-CoA dehydrogenase NAD-binding domain-containing protein, partial [Streptosporangiaceae bacterium]|nr:3-hydroxyacyl-CoA dehydrogenase NAD-binding domain-containing protein [Streptosporangiaceae bacterium]
MTQAPPPPGRALRVAVVGAGLVGTSAALALRQRGARVWLSDDDPTAARLAADLGAGEVLGDAGPPP